MLEEKKKELAALKDNEKIKEKAVRERTKLAEIERERNTIEERLKALGELKERENDLKLQNEEDQ